MKKILIALDYEPLAQKIAETGYELAKKLEAKIVLVHVVSDVVYYSSLNYPSVMGYDGFNNLDMLQLTNTDGLKKAAQDYLDISKQHLGDDSIETIVAEGDFGESILEVGKQINADIIVMGTHGRHGLDKLLMGSVAEEVLHKSPIPLFIIPTKNFEDK